jgi:hypothetical protein
MLWKYARRVDRLSMARWSYDHEAVDLAALYSRQPFQHQAVWCGGHLVVCATLLDGPRQQRRTA